MDVVVESQEPCHLAAELGDFADGRVRVPAADQAEKVVPAAEAFAQLLERLPEVVAAHGTCRHVGRDAERILPALDHCLLPSGSAFPLREGP